jgi:hypothetical protein
MLGMKNKQVGLREELIMSFRTIVVIATSTIIGIACVVTVSTATFAATAPAGTTRLHHHHHHKGVHHSGHVQVPKAPATKPPG